MIYLDYGATSFHKPQSVYRAVENAMRRCASPGRGGYPAAQQGAQAVFACRETAAIPPRMRTTPTAFPPKKRNPRPIGKRSVSVWGHWQIPALPAF